MSTVESVIRTRVAELEAALEGLEAQPPRKRDRREIMLTNVRIDEALHILSAILMASSRADV